MRSTELRQLLATFDGRDTTPLERAAVALPATRATADRLLALAADESSTLVGATWVIKNMVEAGLELEPVHGEALVALLTPTSDDWAALHVLQTLPFVELTRRAQDALHAALVHLLGREHKFTRAWAYNALALLARADARWRPDALDRLERAYEDEAASVRARIRNAMRELED